MSKRPRGRRAEGKGSLFSAGVLARQPTTENLQRCHEQSQSPLFSLPAEIRNTIFELVTSSYDDPKYRYKPTDVSYRPGYHAKHIADLALLSTCRRIWLEANAWPLYQATPTFWFEGEERRPAWARRQRVRNGRIEDVPETERMVQFFSELTEATIANFALVRIFGQVNWLKRKFWNADTFGRTCPEFSLPILAVAIRHTDWPRWDRDDSLELDIEWLSKLLSASNAEHPFVPQREFRLELETLDYKVDQLLVIIERIRQRWASGEEDTSWELQRDSGEQTLAWSGPTTVCETRRFLNDFLGKTEFEYRVFTLVWRRRSDTLE